MAQRSALLVAATGGHLARLVRLRPRVPGLDGLRVVWVTFDTPQSRSVLCGEAVRSVRPTGSRDLAVGLRDRRRHLLAPARAAGGAAFRIG